MQVLLGEQIFFYAWLIPPFFFYNRFTGMRLRHRQFVFPHQHTCGEPGCLRVFETSLERKEHAKLAGHRPYRCECGQLDSNKAFLLRHITHANRAASKSIGHTQAAFKELHTCAEEGCRRVCSNGRKLQEHAKVTGHKAYQCVCGKCFSKLCSLGRHLDESRDDGEGKYKCPNCKSVRGFKRLNHLEQHLHAWHRVTDEEIKAVLLPLRKRKTRASKSALTTGPATKQDAAPKAPSPKEQPDSFVGSTAEARTAFLALTTGAIPLAQDANTTALTEGPAEDLADLDAGPVDFNLGTPSEGLTLDGNNTPFQAPHWLNQFDFQTVQGTEPSVVPLNGLSSSPSAHGDTSGAFLAADFNSYMPSSSYGLPTPSLNNWAPFASPFGESQFDGPTMQYDTLSMAPNVGTFTNQYEPLTAYPPLANTIPQWPASVNYGQMGYLPFNSVSPGVTAGKTPLGSMLSYPGALPVNLGNPTFASVGFNTEAYTQPLTDFTGYDSLSGASTAAEPHSQVFHGQADR